MANEFIDNIVAQKAFDQVNDMRKALADLQAQYAQLIQVINAGIASGNRGASTRLTEEAKIQAEILRTKERIVALDSVASSGNKLGQELNDVKQDLKDINKELKNTNVISDSLAGMRLELAKLEKQYTALGKAARESTGGQQMLKDFQAQQTAVSKLEQQMGNYKRNVGNYSNATFQLSQSLRELPAFAFSAQTGILALSNNLPMLVDSFNEVKKSTGSAGSALAVFGRSIFTFTNLFTIALGLFTVFYKEIMQFVSGTKEAAKVNKTFAESMNEASASLATELVHLQNLYSVATDVTMSMRDRKAAVDELQRIYPNYLGNLKDEVILAGQAEKAYTALTDALINKAIFSAFEEQQKPIAERIASMTKVLKDLEKEKNAVHAIGATDVPETMAQRTERFNKAISEQKGLIESAKEEMRLLYEEGREFFSLGSGGTQTKEGTAKKEKETNRIELLKTQYENELLVADTAYKKGELGYMQHQWRIVEITEEFARKRLNAIQNLSKKESDSRVQLENDMISNLTKATTDIGETGIQASYKLAKERGKEFADEYIKGLKESIKNNLTAEGQAAAVNWFNTMVATAKPPNLSNIGGGDDDEEKKRERIINNLNALRNVIGEIGNLSDTLFSRELAQLDLKIQKQQEAFDLEEEHIKQMGLSKEEEAKRLAKLEAQKGAQEKLNAQERKKILRQQAIMNKAFTVMQISLSTYMGVMNALAGPPPLPPNPVLATAIGIAGGVQIAAALAVPIPQFAEGTESAPEGYAIVGEKGTELVTEPSGKQWLTPAKDTLTYLKKGSKVTTNEDLMDMVKNQAFATLATMNKPITTDLYGKQLIEQFEALTSKVDKLSDVMSNKNMSTQIVGNFDHYMHVKNRVK
jgi:hypothetical protein